MSNSKLLSNNHNSPPAWSCSSSSSSTAAAQAASAATTPSSAMSMAGGHLKDDDMDCEYEKDGIANRGNTNDNKLPLSSSALETEEKQIVPLSSSKDNVIMSPEEKKEEEEAPRNESNNSNKKSFAEIISERRRGIWFPAVMSGADDDGHPTKVGSSTSRATKEEEQQKKTEEEATATATSSSSFSTATSALPIMEGASTTDHVTELPAAAAAAAKPTHSTVLNSNNTPTTENSGVPVNEDDNDKVHDDDDHDYISPSSCSYYYNYTMDMNTPLFPFNNNNNTTTTTERNDILPSKHDDSSDDDDYDYNYNLKNYLSYPFAMETHGDYDVTDDDDHGNNDKDNSDDDDAEKSLSAARKKIKRRKKRHYQGGAGMFKTNNNSSNNNNNKTGTNSTKNGSSSSGLDSLSDDLLHQILSYIPDLPTLGTFALTSQRAHRIVYDSVHSEELFGGTWRRTFGLSGVDDVVHVGDSNVGVGGVFASATGGGKGGMVPQDRDGNDGKAKGGDKIEKEEKERKVGDVDGGDHTNNNVAVAEKNTSPSKKEAKGSSSSLDGTYAKVGWKEKWQTLYDIRIGLQEMDTEGVGSGGGSKNSSAAATDADAHAVSAPTAIDSTESTEPKGTNATTNVTKEHEGNTNESRSRKCRKTVGVLSATDESDAILYDNPEYIVDTDALVCNGYFGMETLNIRDDFLVGRSRRKKEYKRFNQNPVVVWGDFCGVRIFDSLDDLLYEEEKHDGVGATEEANDRPKRREGTAAVSPTPSARFVSVGERDGGGQVLAVVTCPLQLPSRNANKSGSDNDDERDEDEQGEKQQRNNTPPCLFLGFASGMVMSVTASRANNSSAGGGSYKYDVLSTSSLHTGEVTALAFLPSPIDGESPVLASGSIDGRVYVWPHAMSEKGNFTLGNPSLACTTTNNTPIFNLSATRWVDEKHMTSRVLLCIGDGGGNVSLWSSKPTSCGVISNQHAYTTSSVSAVTMETDVDIASDVGLENGMDSSWDGPYYFKHEQTCKSSSKRSQAGVVVVQVQFYQNYGMMLITGNTCGELRVWDIQYPNNLKGRESDSVHLPSDDNLDCGPQIPRLVLRHSIAAAHCGTVESIKILGNLAMTSGGNDGEIKGWDLTTGQLLGVIPCHPGVEYPRTSSTDEQGQNGGRKPKGAILKSAVVGSLIHSAGGYMVILCRDGTLHKWSYNYEKERDVVCWFCHHENRVGFERCSRCHQRRSGRTLSALARATNLRQKWKGGSSAWWNSVKNGILTSVGIRGAEIADRCPPSQQLTIDDLKGIMGKRKSNDGDDPSSLRSRMRASIVIAALHHAKQPTATLMTTEFLGADGRVYDDIKKAFSLFGGMRPCSKCRADRQGPFVCRLRLEHESPDFDNPRSNSMSTLRDIIRGASEGVGIKNVISTDVPRSSDATSRPSGNSVRSERSVDQSTDDEGSSRDAESDVEESSQTAVEDIEAESGWKCQRCKTENPINLTRTDEEKVDKLGQDAETMWGCERCETPNESNRKRCKNCMGWKDGKHPCRKLGQDEGTGSHSP